MSQSTEVDLYNIKPHHFLDILKLYGNGLEDFTKDQRYGHDFWKIGNLILNNPETELVITDGGDDICSPCIFYKPDVGKCGDKMPAPYDEQYTKETWNKMIDGALMERLHLENGKSITAIALARLCLSAMSTEQDAIEFFDNAWQEENPDLREKRRNLTVKGLLRYVRKHDPGNEAYKSFWVDDKLAV